MHEIMFLTKNSKITTALVKQQHHLTPLWSMRSAHTAGAYVYACMKSDIVYIESGLL